jgi:hypothetical protein
VKLVTVVEELFQQVRDIDHQIECLESFKEALFKRIDKELEGE